MFENPSFGTEGTLAFDNLFGGDFPVVSRTVTIANGQNLQRGAVLGKVTASGEYVLSASAAVDGSETPVAILAQDTDASGGALEAPAYLAGEFNERALTLGAGHTLGSIRDGLRDLNIYLKATVAQ